MHMLWLKLRVGGQRIKVYLVRDSHPKLEGCNGIYHPDTNTVYISSALPVDEREDTLFHELDHVVNDKSGAGKAMEIAVPRRKQRDDLEEQMVRCRTPIWHALLKDLGFRFPKGPTD
jgi:Zn-dependent peptidase ImmA (M78 family)